MFKSTAPLTPHASFSCLLCMCENKLQPTCNPSPSTLPAFTTHLQHSKMTTAVQTSSIVAVGAAVALSSFAVYKYAYKKDALPQVVSMHKRSLTHHPPPAPQAAACCPDGIAERPGNAANTCFHNPPFCRLPPPGSGGKTMPAPRSRIRPLSRFCRPSRSQTWRHSRQSCPPGRRLQ